MKKFKYLAFHKPYGVLSQFTGEKPEETLAGFGLPKGVYACGRLDKDSEGLLLLTDDGSLIHRLLDPKFNKSKTYWVQVEKIPSNDALNKLENGVRIGDYTTLPCLVRVLEPQPLLAPRVPPIRERKTIPTCWLEISIVEGKNRQIRRMTAAIGHPTLRLIRKKIGSLHIGNLKPGEFREIKKEELF